MNKESFNALENITEDKHDAKITWYSLEKVLKKLGNANILENPTVIDLGGGLAELSKHLNTKGINCASIDIKDLKTNPNSNQVRADMYKMPFADDSADIMISTGSLDTNMYLHDRPKLLKEIARVLKSGGVLSLTHEITPENGYVLDDNFKIISKPGDMPFLIEKK